jgi:hypothetical protein
MNSLRFIKNVLYTLKREYGFAINIVWKVSDAPNYRTGKRNVAQDSVSVDRAIVLPASTQRDFVYDLTFIASNKNFTYGGLFDKNRRRVFIDKSDLPTDFEIKIGYYLIIKGKRFEVKEVDLFDEGAGYELDVTQLDNIDLENHIELRYYQDLFLEQTVEVTVE